MLGLVGRIHRGRARVADAPVGASSGSRRDRLKGEVSPGDASDRGASQNLYPLRQRCRSPGPALVFSSRCSLSQKHKQLKMAPTGEELEKQAAALRESNPGNRAAK